MFPDRKNLSVTADNLLSIGLVIVLLAICLGSNLSMRVDQQFTYLGSAFLDGQLFFDGLPADSIHDIVVYHGRYFWASGLLPPLLFMPLVVLGRLFGFFFLQGYLQFFITAAIVGLTIRLAKHHGFSKTEARYLAFAFVAASTLLHIALVSSSYFLAHALTVMLVLWALDEFYTTRRPWIIGSLMALAAMTRLTAGLGLIFFILSEFFPEPAVQKSLTSRFNRITWLVLPMIVGILLLALYNLARFDKPWESGYGLMLLTPQLGQSLSAGVFSLKHLPGNLYYFFLGHPLPVFRDGLSHILKPPYLRPDPWGMSIFITSPYYLLLFISSPQTRREKFLWITVTLIAIPVFLYYGIGWVQMGYRYSLDWLPFLFILFLTHLKRTSSTLSLRMKFLFVSSFLANLFLTLAIYNPSG